MMRIQSTKGNSTWLRLSATTALAVALALSAAPRAFAQDASGVQAQVTSNLQNDAALSGANITATASGTQVTLTGSVQDEKQWQEAETVAANTPGVRTIQNNLVISGPAGASTDAIPPPPPDADQNANQDASQNPDQGQPAAVSDGQVPPPPPPDSGADLNNAQPENGQYRSQYQGQDQGGNQGYGYGSQNYANQPQEQGEYAPPQEPPSGPVTVPVNSLMEIRIVEPLDTANLIQGQLFDATAANDVYVGNVLAIPRGAEIQGKVVRLKKAGPFGGNTLLALKLTGLNLGGQFYPLDSNTWWNRGPNKAGYTAGNTVAGSAFGAILGGIIGGGTGAAIGAGVGAAGGLGASAASHGPRVILPSETMLAFHLEQPVTVQPVSWQEARRLAANTPQLQQRPMYQRVYAYPYPYAYGYPPPPPYYYGPSVVSLGWGWGW